jgi:hypothetical protein
MIFQLFRHYPYNAKPYISYTCILIIFNRAQIAQNPPGRYVKNIPNNFMKVTLIISKSTTNWVPNNFKVPIYILLL